MANDSAGRKAPANDHSKPKKIKLNHNVDTSRSGTPAGSGEAAKPPTSASADGDGVETQQCKHCKKHVPRDGFTGHSKQCLRDKKEKKRQKEAQAAAAQAAIDRGDKEDAEGDADDMPLAKIKTTESALGGSSATSKKKVESAADTESAKKTKKRKADEAPADKPAPKKQKKKEEANKPKAPKPKAPVDVEKQCGVPMENGALCARSLTCKSHSMSAKRSVAGRSARYDVLLAQYQKKNQAKQQKAAMASIAPLVDDFDAAGGEVDSDEEKEAVMSAIARSNPQPLYERPLVSVKARYNHIRMKEMLSNALGGNRGSNLFSVPAPDAYGGLARSAEAFNERRMSQPQYRSSSVSAGV